MAADATAYDAVTYPSRCCPQAHPNRLATLATLFGMSPASVERCRFLELGCGDAWNLLAMASALPGSTFVGIDLAPGAISRGKAEAQTMGLANVELHCADLLEWSAPSGPFDYIIAHGLFSWVPESVRLRVLEICQNHLAPQGVAYISYNTLPGFHIRSVLRDMMRFHAAGASTPVERIERAKEMLRQLVAGQVRNDELAALLKKEAGDILERSADPFLFHDDLAEVNGAYYFHEFMALAEQHGLQFLAEAELVEMQDSIYPPPVVAALRRHGTIAMKEQYLDFLKCRRFRQTLLCHKAVPLDHEPKPSLLHRFLLASQARPKSARPNLATGVLESFTGSRGVSIQADDPLTKAALLELLSAWPRALPLESLVAAARRRIGIDGDPEVLAADLLFACSAGLVELHLHQPAWEARQGGRPTLGSLARQQLTAGREIVTSLRHVDTLVGEPVLRTLFLLLDGSRDVAAVVAELGKQIDAGELELPAGVARKELDAEVGQAIRDAVSKDLLIAWDDGEAR